MPRCGGLLHHIFSTRHPAAAGIAKAGPITVFTWKERRFLSNGVVPEQRITGQGWTEANNSTTRRRQTNVPPHLSTSRVPRQWNQLHTSHGTNRSTARRRLALCHHVTLDVMTHWWIPVNTHSTPVLLGERLWVAHQPNATANECYKVHHAHQHGSGARNASTRARTKRPHACLTEGHGSAQEGCSFPRPTGDGQRTDRHTVSVDDGGLQVSPAT